jgi:hypothetical protein
VLDSEARCGLRDQDGMDLCCANEDYGQGACSHVNGCIPALLEQGLPCNQHSNNCMCDDACVHFDGKNFRSIVLYFKHEIRLLPGSRRHLPSTLRRSMDARFNNLIYLYNNRLHNNRGANNHCRAGTLRWLRANAGPLEDVVETGEKSVSNPGRRACLLSE